MLLQSQLPHGGSVADLLLVVYSRSNNKVLLDLQSHSMAAGLAHHIKAGPLKVTKRMFGKRPQSVRFCDACRQFNCLSFQKDYEC